MPLWVEKMLRPHLTERCAKASRRDRVPIVLTVARHTRTWNHVTLRPASWSRPVPTGDPPVNPRWKGGTLTPTSGNVSDISVHQEGDYTLLRMPTDLAQEFYAEFLDSPKTQQIAQDGTQNIRNIFEALKSKWKTVAGARSSSGSVGN